MFSTVAGASSRRQRRDERWLAHAVMRQRHAMKRRWRGAGSTRNGQAPGSRRQRRTLMTAHKRLRTLFRTLRRTAVALMARCHAAFCATYRYTNQRQQPPQEMSKIRLLQAAKPCRRQPAMRAMVVIAKAARYDNIMSLRRKGEYYCPCQRLPTMNG